MRMHAGSVEVSSRVVYSAGFAICTTMMLTALYLQYGIGLEPCPLCIFQRIVVVGLGLVFLAAAVHNPTGAGNRVYGALLTLLAVGGGAIAARHVWLQHLPEDQVPDCGPSLEYMLEAFPLGRTLELVFRGSGECARVLWRFLGLSIPGWTLLAFSAFAMLGIWLVLAPRRQPAE
jgi:disulfide bond formation protein DsbB